MEIRACLAALAVLAAGCPSTDVSPPPQPSANPQPSAAPTAPAPFENPGGMWPPEQLDKHAATLEQIGFELDPAVLTKPMEHPLGAIVSLGGCSASFVSHDGLIITNHHCATGALQFNSTKDKNLLETGFLARTRAEEPNNGPRARVFVTLSFRDVTALVRAGIDEEKDHLARYRLVEQRQKDLVAGCEKDRPHLRCSVVSYYGGEAYRLIEQLEIRDVRLVYAPAEGIGNFGGEVDNWRWPRHVGDVSFFRAYVGPDGKPADFAPENVPYKPAHILKVASQPLGPGDMVFVAGYPGQTNRLRTAREVGEAVDWYYPRHVSYCVEYLALLEGMAKGDPELDVKSRGMVRGLANSLTNTRGMLDGLQKGGLKAQKERLEAALLAWIGEHAEHQSGRAAIDNLALYYSMYRGERDADAASGEILGMSRLLGAAETIAHMAEERPKPDAERHPSFQQRNHKRLEQYEQQAQQSYDRRLDRARLKLALMRAARLGVGDQPDLLAIIVPGEPTEAAIDAALDKLYKTTKLEDAKERIRLLKEASSQDLARSKDPFIQLGLKVRPIAQAIEDRGKAYDGAALIDRPQYVSALRAHKGGVLAPDANGTLRITYGTVRGYRPKPDAEIYYPFTKLSEVVKKHTGTEPFDAPDALLAAAKAGPFEGYTHGEFPEVPVDFLSDLDITGGNSGSPTINARGELVGLVFDGNYESMASDWVFIPEVTRSIHVDIRYILWLMDAVDEADHLLVEMGLTPRIE